ncbi:hypothetical protein LTR36_005382 [Oleoguttula mirabilis]|uniref:Uncharacterized protein n=1 Tax=Oleoguttula mirabilis TaxID=1507867 RepID=A0AAV9JFR0_9PEZI|nr:hypothetical protein LTR36_005382 [Oleoguttula mirabilis]
MLSQIKVPKPTHAEQPSAQHPTPMWLEEQRALGPQTTSPPPEPRTPPPESSVEPLNCTKPADSEQPTAPRPTEPMLVCTDKQLTLGPKAPNPPRPRPPPHPKPKPPPKPNPFPQPPWRPRPTNTQQPTAVGPSEPRLVRSDEEGKQREPRPPSPSPPLPPPEDGIDRRKQLEPQPPQPPPPPPPSPKDGVLSTAPRLSGLESVRPNEKQLPAWSSVNSGARSTPVRDPNKPSGRDTGGSCGSIPYKPPPKGKAMGVFVQEVLLLPMGVC